MRLQNEFIVPVAPPDAFETLSDVERIAPCLPGAQLESLEGDTFTGRVSVGIGPVRLKMTATGKVVRCDSNDRVLVIDGDARDKSGHGAAHALITLTVQDTEDSGPDQALVTVVTELELAGRMGQFGGAAISQVNRRLVDQFVQRLDELIQRDHGDGEAAATAVQPRSGVTAGSTRERLRLGGWRDALSLAASIAAGAILGATVARAVRRECTRECTR